MAADEEWFDDDAGPVVRPYAVTGGRTRPADASLELVALVSTTAHGSWLTPRLDPEKQAIAALCREIQSIAEISARLGLPLGVARVLVGDMVDEGLVLVHRPARPGERPDVTLLEKVLYGLRAI